MQKYVYTEFSHPLFLSLTRRIGSTEPAIIQGKKVQWKVHFVESMVFFPFAWLWICLFSSAFMLLQYHTHTPDSHRETPNSISSNAETKNERARNSKISKPAAVTNHLGYHHFSWLLRVYFLFFQIVLIRLLFVRFWFGLVLVALFMCLNVMFVHEKVYGGRCIFIVNDILLYFTLSISHIFTVWAFRMSFFNGETDTKMKLSAKKKMSRK